MAVGKTSEQQLSFGDAGFHLAEHSPDDREGGVRNGKKPDFKPPLGSLGETGLKIPPLASSSSSALAFGDSSSFMRELERPEDREGGVRGGVKPDFHKPLGDLGNVGLKMDNVGLKSAPHNAETLAISTKGSAHATHGTEGNVHGHEDQEEEEVDKKLAALAFGDADYHPSTQAVSDREGSVRGGKTPDFAPPLGDLGSVGLTPKHVIPQPKLHPLASTSGQTLVAKPSSSSSSSSSFASSSSSKLAFGDAHFHADPKPAEREGSVRGGNKPDFAPPLGDLGQTGLVAAKHLPGGSKSAVDKRISAAAERQDVAKFFAKEESAAKGKAKADLTAKAARSQVSNYFGKLAQAAAASNSKQSQVRGAAARSAEEKEAAYEGTLLARDQARDQRVQAQREKMEQAASAHARHAQHAKATAAAAQVKVRAEAEGGDAQVADAEEKTAEADMDGMSDNLVPAKDAGRGEMWARNSKGGLESRTAREESSSNKAKLEQLALKYDKDGGNKHGFHPGSMAKSVAVKKELEAARAIEKSDLDDCTFTLC